jgi:uncharacterized repeat protein (TIGR04076 family)
VSAERPLRVLATVVEIKGDGICPAGFKIGDRIVFNGLRADKNPKCLEAICAIFPKVQAMEHGAHFSWADGDGASYTGCPDPIHTVVFKLEPATRQGKGGGQG